MFELFITAFNLILYQPLFNALVLLYEYLPGYDFGVAVIVLTLIIKLIFYPLAVQGIRVQKALQQLQPKIKEIQEKFKYNREKMARAMMELYQKEKINPFSGCLPLLIQLPILIALYKVFWKGFGSDQLYYLYGFVPHPGVIDYTFLGLIDLSQPYWPLALITGISQYFQTKMVTPKTKPTGSLDFSQMLQKQMLYFFPFFTFLILLKLPSALALYWLVSTIFTIFQQYFIFKKLS